MSKERFTELMYEYEKNSFLLSILEARLAVVLHAESMGYSDTVTSLIAKISPQYVKMLRAIKDKNGGSIEEMAQIAFDKIYVYDGSKRNYSKFREFDTSLLEEWFALKQRERELRVGLIKQDEAIADFKHAFYINFGADISVSIESEEKEQEEQGQKEDPEEDDAEEMLQAFNKQLAEEALLIQMYRDGVIDETVCRKYMNAEELSLEAFQRLLEIHSEEEGQKDSAESMAHAQKLEYQMELIAKLVDSEDITRNRAFEIMNINNDFHDFVEFLKILEIWEEKIRE